MPPRSNSTTNNQKVVATDKSAPPVGIRLGSALTIGPRIGSGAFGAVHAVVDSSLVAPGNKSKNTLLWACKLTAVPDNGGGTSRKKNGSDAQVAYQQLWAEHLIYTCQCRSLTGTVLPRLPDPTNNNNNDLKDFYDNANGYRCLVMERMEGELFDALPAMLLAVDRSHNNKKKPATTMMNLGPICGKLVDIFEAIHKTGHMLLDVKPENLMVAFATNAASTTTNPVDPVAAVADRIRVVDLGLVKMFLGPDGHVPDTGSAAVQGTPLYASHTVHAHHTPSRRDDMESLVYVLGDLVLTLLSVAAAHNKKQRPPPPSYVRGSPPATSSSFLPWSQDGSDEAMGRTKEKHVGINTESEYYKAMPPAAAGILFAALKVVRGCEYAKKPPYAVLRTLLSTLAIPLNPTNNNNNVENTNDGGIVQKKSSTPTKKSAVGNIPDKYDDAVSSMTTTVATVSTMTTTTTTSTSPLRRSTRHAKSSSFGDDDANGVPNHNHAMGSGSESSKVVMHDDDNDVIMQDAVPKGATKKRSSNENMKPSSAIIIQKPSKVSRRDADKDSAAPETHVDNTLESNTKPNRRHAALIRMTKGSLLGKEHRLEMDTPLVIGSAPSRRGGGKFHGWSISGDAQISPNHVMLELKLVSGIVSVQVTDLKSTTGTFILNRQIPSGKGERVFPGGVRIRCGDQELKVLKP